MMDRYEAIELLQSGPRGVQQWNRVRQDGESIPDLSSANLSRRDLMDADLHGVCLQGACFGGSDVDRADLSEADLRYADMAACCLCAANLRCADLRQANLRCACVACADFTNADLTGANLAAVDFSTVLMRVVDPKDVRASMRRVDWLPLRDDARHCVLEILQKADIAEDLTERARQEVAACVDSLIKELLKRSLDSGQIARLLEDVRQIAPELVDGVSEEALFEQRAASALGQP
jgi:hypothetical protein